MGWLPGLLIHQRGDQAQQRVALRTAGDQNIGDIEPPHVPAGRHVRDKGDINAGRVPCEIPGAPLTGKKKQPAGARRGGAVLKLDDVIHRAVAAGRLRDIDCRLECHGTTTRFSLRNFPAKRGRGRPPRPGIRGSPAIAGPLPPGFLHGKKRLERPQKLPVSGGVTSFRIDPVYAGPLIDNQHLRARDGLIQLGERCVFHDAGNAWPPIWFRGSRSGSVILALSAALFLSNSSYWTNGPVTRPRR